MKNVLITGYNGFIGKNLIDRLKRCEKIIIHTYGREHNDDYLKTKLEKADIIFHLAGTNRANDDEAFYEGNVRLSKKIVNYLGDNKRKVPLVFTSSIQVEKNNTYGRTKRKAEEHLIKYSEDTLSPVTMYRLTNVFGKWCKPNYNSVVATFCYNIIRNLPIEIHDERKKITLIYIDDLIDELENSIWENGEPIFEFRKIESTFTITLRELANKIHQFKQNRETGIVPDFSDIFTRYLFATYSSYLQERKFLYGPEINEDDRGVLFELIKSNNFGQIFVSTTKEGVTRGNHFHDTKVEKFCVLKGEAVVKLKHRVTGSMETYSVSDKNFKIIDIPPGYTHSIKNIGDEDMIVLFWANEIFNPSKPDTFYDCI